MPLSSDEMRDIFQRTVIVRRPRYGIVSGYHELPYVCLGASHDTGFETMEVRGKVNEQERNNVAAGQTATVTSDSLPGESLTATVSAVSGMVQSGGMFSDAGGPLREFDVILTLNRSAERLRPGTTVGLVIAGTKVDNVLHVPRQAVFERNGKPVVYLRVGGRFEVREVKLKYRTEARIALEGIAAGAEVALINPDKAVKPAAKSSAPAPGAAK